jgi:hypothetical protein
MIDSGRPIRTQTARRLGVRGAKGQGTLLVSFIEADAGAGW